MHACPKTLTAIGLMSGTSMDGVDVALLRTDGETVLELGDHASFPFDETARTMLRRALEDARDLRERDARPGVLGEAEALMTDRHATAVRAFLDEQGLKAADIDVIGFHGQTVLHRPEAGLTVQIGEGPRLAAEIGCPVVYDLRAADMAAGGQGAPLVPIFHQAMVRASELTPPVAVVNIGGVANVSLIGSGDAPTACDTGPGNALIDDFVRERTGRPFDHRGELAARGRVDRKALDALLSHAFFRLPWPKSLDRNAFSRAPVAHLSNEDGAATLTAFTAASLATVVDGLPEAPKLWVVSGGGARNATLMTMLRACLPGPVRTAREVGWSEEAVEAQAFAYLAVRSLKGLPLTFPTTTGVPAPTTGGVLARP